jgi:hypothetical protein
LLAKVPENDPKKLLRRVCSTPSAMLLHAQINTATIQTIVTRDYSTDLQTHWRICASVSRRSSSLGLEDTKCKSFAADHFCWRSLLCG